MARKNATNVTKIINEEYVEDPVSTPRGLGPESAGQSGDLQGLSETPARIRKVSKSCWKKGRLWRPTRFPAWKTHPTPTPRRCASTSAPRTTCRKSTAIRTRVLTDFGFRGLLCTPVSSVVKGSPTAW